MGQESLKDRLRKQREELSSRQSKGNFLFLKADDTIRVRILPVPEEEEFAVEVIQFYLGEKLKGVISPASIHEPCALFEGYQELKNSDDPDDKEIAKSLSPRRRFLLCVAKYKDLKGKEFESDEKKFILLTPSMYQDILDYFLDEDDWGDMTNAKDGYDLKLSRTGSSKTDTEYSVMTCQKSPLKEPFKKVVVDLKEEFKKLLPSYDETKKYLDQFLGVTTKDDDDSKKSSKKPLKKVIKKK